MNALIGFILLIVVALVGLGIAALKYKLFPYNESAEEVASEKAAKEKLEKDGYVEMDISDVIRIISSKGYKAV